MPNPTAKKSRRRPGSRAVTKALLAFESSEKQGLTMRFAQQTGICPRRFSRLCYGGLHFQQLDLSCFGECSILPNGEVKLAAQTSGCLRRPIKGNVHPRCRFKSSDSCPFPLSSLPQAWKNATLRLLCRGFREEGKTRARGRGTPHRVQAALPNTAPGVERKA